MIRRRTVVENVLATFLVVAWLPGTLLMGASLTAVSVIVRVGAVLVPVPLKHQGFRRGGCGTSVVDLILCCRNPAQGAFWHRTRGAGRPPELL